MKFSTIFAFAAAAIAAPGQGWTGAGKCNINDKTAQGLVDGCKSALVPSRIYIS